MVMSRNLIFWKMAVDRYSLGMLGAFLSECLVTALSGKFEEMQYNELGDSDEGPDVSELEALKRSASARTYSSLGFFVVIYVVL